MADRLTLGVCTLALALLPATAAIARHHSHPTHCATPTEVTAIAATSIQQELMDAALTCDRTEASKEFVNKYNTFQTTFGPELRASDRTLLRMFQRLYGGRGSDEYNAFKTRMASDAELRRDHGFDEFCAAANQVYAAALAANKPTLSDFVSGVQVQDPSPVDSCQMQVAMGLEGAMAATSIMPRQKPVEFQDVAMSTGPTPPPPGTMTNAPLEFPTAAATATTATAAAPAAATAAAPAATASATAPAAATTTASDADQQKKKSGGWFSGLFN